jgi:ubiquitin carboxyl-terminal hydrolase 44/49
LYRWAEFCYAQPGLLFFGGALLMSELGVQQGDPLGPLLFSVVLHSLVKSIEERVPGLDVHVWYLDDGTIIGDIDLVARALDVIEEVGPKLGAHLNHGKSEIWWPSRADKVEVFPSQIIRVPNRGVELLGSPIGSQEFMREFVKQRVEKISTVDLQLEEMDDAQIELALLRGCLGFGKVVHLLRTCPPPDILEALEGFDDRLRSRIASILRAPFLEVDAWKQASLPIRLGGLGITHTVPLAGPAFIGSCALTHDLVAAILRRDPDHYSPPHVSDIAASHSLLTGSLIRYEDLRRVPKVQKRLMDERHDLESKSLLTTGSLRLRARLRGLSQPHAGDWLYALPIAALDQRVQSRPFRIMLRRHLGVPIPGHPSKCPLCARPCDSFGDHAGVCSAGGDKTRRHNAVRDILFLAARGAALSVEKEPKHLLLHGGQKPADLLVRNYTEGFHASAFDVTISDTLQPTSLDRAAAESGYVARVAHEKKLQKYQDSCRESNLAFFPMVWESTGGTTSTVHSTIESWSNQEADRGGLPRSRIRTRLYQRLSLTLQREYARMIMKRICTQDSSWML